MKRLINESAREMSKNEVRRAVVNFNRIVHVSIRNNGAYFEAEMYLGIFTMIQCKSPLFLSISSYLQIL